MDDNILNSQISKIEEMYANGQLTDAQYAEALNKIHSQTKVEVPQAKPKVDFSEMVTEEDMTAINNMNFSDDNIAYKEIQRNGINYNIDKGRVRNIDTFSEDGNVTTSNIVYDKDFNPIELNNPEGTFPIPGVINDDIKALRREELAGMSSADWEAAEKNLEQYGFSENANVLDERIKVTSNKKNAIDEQIRELKKNKSTPKSTIEELEAQKKKLNIQEEGLSYRQKLRSENKVEARTNYKASQKDIVDEFKNKTSNLSKESREYVNAQKEMKSAIQKLGEESEYGSYIRSNKNNTLARVENLNAKPLRPMKVLNAAFAVKQGIDKYKESRAEGKGVASSAVRGAGSVAVGEALGPVGYIIYDAAKTLPKAVVKGTNALYSETRKMNSASNFTPLGGVSFQDTQQLATMRQSGMELAKMSQYNLEQTLMGAEAKHLHR